MYRVFTATLALRRDNERTEMLPRLADIATSYRAIYRPRGKAGERNERLSGLPKKFLCFVIFVLNSETRTNISHFARRQ